MANAITVCKMTTVNSSVAVSPTLTEIGTATGVYIDCRHIDASRMILIMAKETSGAGSATQDSITILDGDSKANYSGYGLGNLEIMLSSLHCTAPKTTDQEINVCFAGPFETARFKDSNGRIDITALNGINVACVGAILI